MDVSVASTNERLLPSNDNEKKSAIAKSDLSQDEWNQTFDELTNIQHHMSLTKEHIDLIVATFSNHPQPPKIYITEYEEATNKLYNFQRLEEKLKDKLGLENVDANSSEATSRTATVSTQVSGEYDLDPVPPSPLSTNMSDYNGVKDFRIFIYKYIVSSLTSDFSYLIFSKKNFQIAEPSSYLQTHRPSYTGPLESPPPNLSSGDEFIQDYSNSSSQPNSACIPKSPAKEKFLHIKAYLGDHGSTHIKVIPGVTLRESLSKAMKLRKMGPETCAVFKYSDPAKVMHNGYTF